jgi:hypothetical protein
MAGDAKTQASGVAREAEGTVQDLYGQAARDATDAAVGLAKDAYENSGETQPLRRVIDLIAPLPTGDGLNES